MRMTVQHAHVFDFDIHRNANWLNIIRKCHTIFFLFSPKKQVLEPPVE